MVQFRNNTRKSGKYLNSKRVRLNDLRLTAFKGTNGSALKLSLKFGEFTSDNVTLMETAINNGIVRIPLKRYNLKDLKSKNRTRKSIGNFQKSKKVSRRSTRGTLNLNGLNTISIPLNKKQISKSKENEKRSRKTAKDKSLPREKKESTKKSLKIKKNSSTENIKDIRKAKKGYTAPTNTTTKLESKKTSKEFLQKVKPTKVLQRFDRSKLKIRLFPNKRSRGKGTDQTTNLRKPEAKLPSQSKNSFHQRRYYLKFENPNSFAEHKLNYEFKKLVTDVQNNMKLPSPTWKIKIMIKQNKLVSAITFTNKLDLERSVSFSAETCNYNIIIDNEPALLLGSPGLINSAQDIEILLDVIENIEKHDPMILYK